MAVEVTPGPHAQAGARIRFDWGLAGAIALSATAATNTVFVVVDVLSFGTTVSVALDLGIAVYPYRWADSRAQDYAARHSAVLAHGRRHGGVSLSPASLRAATGLTRLVLPSPNGATITLALAERGGRVIIGCLRNARAVGHWLNGRLAEDSTLDVVLIAAGERWPDGSLRPAVEDLWGAGAILGAIEPAFVGSPEARAALAAFDTAARTLSEQLRGCASGQELIGYGFGEDVDIAAERDASAAVPVLTGERFLPASTP